MLKQRKSKNLCIVVLMFEPRLSISHKVQHHYSDVFEKALNFSRSRMNSYLINNKHKLRLYLDLLVTTKQFNIPVPSRSALRYTTQQVKINTKLLHIWQRKFASAPIAFSVKPKRSTALRWSRSLAGLSSHYVGYGSIIYKPKWLHSQFQPRCLHPQWID